MNLNNWQIIGILSLFVFLISLPFKIVQNTNFSGGSIYLVEQYTEANIFRIYASSISGWLESLIEFSILLFLIINIIFIIYSISYNKSYLYVINSLSFSFIILLILYNSISHSLIYFGWGFYLLLSSSLLFIKSNIFIFKNIKIKNISKNNIKNIMFEKDIVVFYIAIWMLFIINILIIILIDLSTQKMLL